MKEKLLSVSLLRTNITLTPHGWVASKNGNEVILDSVFPWIRVQTLKILAERKGS